MAVTADLDVPADHVALDDAFDRLAGLACEMERAVEPTADADREYLWLTADDVDAVEGALRADSSVISVTPIERRSTGCLYQAVLRPGLTSLRRIVCGYSGTLLRASARDRRWRLAVRFSTRTDLSAAHDHLRDSSIPISVSKICERPTDRGGPATLTSPQYAALRAAYDLGYFEVPRAASLEEVADEVGISHQALSERLRRAQSVVVGRHVASTADESIDS